MSIKKGDTNARVHAFSLFFSRQHGDLLPRPKLLKSSLIVRPAHEFSRFSCLPSTPRHSPPLDFSTSQILKPRFSRVPMHFYFYTIHLLIYGKSFYSGERFIIIAFVKFTRRYDYFFYFSINSVQVNYYLNTIIKFLLFCENVVRFLIKFELIASLEISFTFLRVILYVQLNLY